MAEEDFGDDEKAKYYRMVVLTNRKLLVDDTFCDLFISVGSEKNPVPAHAAIVASRCEELLAMPRDDDKKKGAKKPKRLEAKVKGDMVANNQIMKHVLEFLYSGRVDFPKLQMLDVLELNRAARHFKLERLVYLCEFWLSEHMTMDNVFPLIKGANAKKEERVKGFCLKFALNHYSEFIANKDGIHILGIDLFQEVVAAFQTKPVPPTLPSPDQAPPDTLLEDFRKLYVQMPYSDATFQVGGESIRCHKAILAAHSDAFVNLFREQTAGGVELRGISPEAFKSMLRFIYYGDDNVEPLPACELVGFSHQYKLQFLLRICEDRIRNNVGIETVLEILSVAYLPAMAGKDDLVAELKGKCFPFLLDHLCDVDLSPLRTMHPNIAIDIVMKIQESWRSGGGPESGGAPAVPSGGFKLGSQRGGGAEEDDRPLPPPRAKGESKLPPPAPPRDAPPSLASPPPPIVPRDVKVDAASPRSSNSAATPEPPTPKKKESSSPSVTDEASTPKGDKKGKKEEEKKKKEEEKREKEKEKRMAKEKKERERMEKKFKGKKAPAKDPFA